MILYIDGDAFPNLLKPIVLRTIKRLSIQTIVVANKKISIGKSSLVSYVLVDQGADMADHKIIELLQKDDLVITADIPLADGVITNNAYAIDHRGDLYSKENIKQKLTMRNFMMELRDSGEMIKGPKPFGEKDVYAFSNQLHNFLAKHFK